MNNRNSLITPTMNILRCKISAACFTHPNSAQALSEIESGHTIGTCVCVCVHVCECVFMCVSGFIVSYLLVVNLVTHCFGSAAKSWQSLLWSVWSSLAHRGVQLPRSCKSRDRKLHESNVWKSLSRHYIQGSCPRIPLSSNDGRLQDSRCVLVCAFVFYVCTCTHICMYVYMYVCIYVYVMYVCQKSHIIHTHVPDCQNYWSWWHQPV